jgi:hypothetical protein
VEVNITIILAIQPLKRFQWEQRQQAIKIHLAAVKNHIDFIRVDQSMGSMDIFIFPLVHGYAE